MNDLHRNTADLLVAMRRAQAARDFDGAERIAEVICVREPAQEDAVGFLVGRALARNSMLRALNVARGGVQANAGSARLQFQLGLALGASGETEAAARAFALAHARDPDLLVASLWQADCESALGRDEQALRCRLRALGIAERQGLLVRQASLAPPVRERLARAAAAAYGARRDAIEAKLAPLRATPGAGSIDRIDRALLHVYGGDAPVPNHPLQRPSLLFVPGLPDQAWFERDQFPYLRELEAATDAIRDELLAVLADDTGLVPYVDMADAAPAAAMWRELNRSPAWSGYHLYRHGERVDAHCARCPRTMAVLESLPLMRIADHAPEILFSVLRPRTHIPPHTGVINGRLTVHLPLIVPENCGALRAGDGQRAWKEGECLIFDDSFVHEAWNDSDHTRVVLILDAWNPHLSAAEREALGTAIAELGRFNHRYESSDSIREP
ncbi:MAG TPA: aspartyl/asparaginyl beta-hydroxylase domain-containing protein [Xanthomonadaceae bacterium]